MFFENRVENINISEISAFSFPLHLHHNIELTVCTEGALQVYCNGQTKTLHYGDIMVAFPNDVHAYINTEFGKGIMLIFNPNISEVLKNKINDHTYDNFASDNTLIPLLTELYTEFMSKNSSFLMMYGYLHIILDSVLKHLPHSTNKQPIEIDLFSKALKYISCNYTNPLTLKALSKYLGVSQYHLSRIFSEKIPGGFCGYIQNLRIEYAKELLENTKLSIYEILLESGFTNQRTFNRVFKNITGLTPSEFRNKTQPQKIL